ncbi:MAG: hypothetical protein J0L92_12760 [Deltaproteobacteria bacterium]|nr:hypothetical protein [Deltaproteobacteria bacterium]
MRLRPIVVASTACSLLGCYLSHEREPAPSVCEPATVTSCATWEADGDFVPISAPAAVGDYVNLESVLSLDCEVMVSWIVATARPRGVNVTHHTRMLDRRGRAIAPIESHPSITGDATSWSGLRLAVNGARVGAITEREGLCVFVPLDREGHEVGPPIEIDHDVGCRALAASGEGFSFVASAITGGSPVTLRTIDVDGRELARTELRAPAPRTWWSRTMFEDGSFLAYQFSEDTMTIRYTGYLQRFDARGAALSDELVLDDDGVPVHIAETSRGAVMAWTTSAAGGQPVRARPIDREGRPRGETRTVPAEGGLYGLTIRSTPDGGALLVWEESHFDEEPQWRVRVQSLDPEGVPLGPPSLVVSDQHADTWNLVVDPSGDRALYVRSRDSSTLEALPLRCAD